MATTITEGASRLSGRPLTNEKHEHFAHLIARGETAARAYVFCGYSEKGAVQSGSRLLRKAEVAARIVELKTAATERRVEKSAIDRTWVMAMLTENVHRAMQVEPVRDRAGNATGQYAYQGAVANKALELLGKELGMFQTSDDHKPDIAVVMARLNAGRDRVSRMKAEREKSRILEREDQIASKSIPVQN